MPALTEVLGGDLDSNINEFALLHGTRALEAAGGICKTGFDIGFAGSACGTVLGYGFYFSDCSSVCHGYTRAPWNVTMDGVLLTKYSGLHVMLLCKVLCGNFMDCPGGMTDEVKGWITAKCTGPGGTFGARSEYHTIVNREFGGSNNKAIVAFHRDQVYPVAAVIYKKM